MTCLQFLSTPAFSKCPVVHSGWSISMWSNLFNQLNPGLFSKFIQKSTHYIQLNPKLTETLLKWVGKGMASLLRGYGCQSHQLQMNTFSKGYAKITSSKLFATTVTSMCSDHCSSINLPTQNKPHLLDLVKDKRTTIILKDGGSIIKEATIVAQQEERKEVDWNNVMLF